MKAYCSIVDLKHKNVFRMDGQVFAVIRGTKHYGFMFNNKPFKMGNKMTFDCVNDNGQRCQVIADTFDFVELIR